MRQHTFDRKERNYSNLPTESGGRAHTSLSHILMFILIFEKKNCSDRYAGSVYLVHLSSMSFSRRQRRCDGIDRLPANGIMALLILSWKCTFSHAFALRNWKWWWKAAEWLMGFYLLRMNIDRQYVTDWYHAPWEMLVKNASTFHSNKVYTDIFGTNRHPRCHKCSLEITTKRGRPHIWSHSNMPERQFPRSTFKSANAHAPQQSELQCYSCAEACSQTMPHSFCYSRLNKRAMQIKVALISLQAGNSEGWKEKKKNPTSRNSVERLTASTRLQPVQYRNQNNTREAENSWQRTTASSKCDAVPFFKLTALIIHL